MDRAKLKELLAEAEQCIGDGKVYVGLQRAVVAKLAIEGQNTEKARSLLETLQDLLALHIEHCEQLKRQLAAHERRAKKAQKSR